MKGKILYCCLFTAISIWMAACGGSTSTANYSDNRLASNTNRDNATGYSAATPSNSNAANSAATGAAAADDFMKEAAMGGMAEVELGRLAATKATNPEVKKFGQMMVEDHSKANTELKALAAKKKVTLPTELDADKKSLADELRSKSGGEFDESYVEEMVEDHEKDVAEFERQAQNAADPDVKAFAAKTLPTLKKHLDAIKAIQAKMK